MADTLILTGNTAAAIAAKLCKVQVVAAYPITPQTSVTETLCQFIEGGELKAEYVRVESEHSALTVCISASTVGARVFTSTSSHGLLFMHEQVHWAAGSRLPVVMCCVNRAVGAPWSIFNDQQDSIAQRDTGWIQLYCRDNQEIMDTIIQAYRIAEEVYVPVMVCYDGFILSHTTMPVCVPTAESVNSFLPPYKPHTILSADNPRNINPVIFPQMRNNSAGVLCDGYMEMRFKLQEAMDKARDTIISVGLKYSQLTGRDYSEMLWHYKDNDADVLLVGMGTIATEATVAVDQLREKGIKAGVVGIRVYRPFPRIAIQKAVKNAKALIILEKDISYGFEGALCSDIKAALYATGFDAPVHNYVAGLGGRDVKAREISEAVQISLAEMKNKNNQNKTVWINCRK